MKTVVVKLKLVIPMYETTYQEIFSLLQLINVGKLEQKLSFRPAFYLHQS